MTDKLNEQISAFIDDELMSEESELLVRRLCGDDALRQTAARYTLVGDAIRGSLHQIRADLTGHIMRAIEDEELPEVGPEPVAAPARSTPAWSRLVAGGAIAAAVALVAVFAIRPDLAPPDAAPTALRAAAEPVVVPPDRTGNDVAGAFRSGVQPLVLPASTQTQLERYLLRHNQYSKTTMRQGVLVYRNMAAEDPPVDDERDDTAAGEANPR